MIIGVSGYAGSGKDSAANEIERLGFKRVALADRVREMLYATNPIVMRNGLGADERVQELVDTFGWDFVKREYPEVRRLLQGLGTEAGRNIIGENFWIGQLIAKYPDIIDPDSRYVVTDVRFANEAEWVNAHGTLFWIDRPGTQRMDHASESGEPKGYAQHIIINDSTEEELLRRTASAVSLECSIDSRWR